MKEGEEANEQFNGLATALREVGAGWIVDEVVDAIARGKSIPFSELDRREQFERQQDMRRERQKGLKVGNINVASMVTRSFTPSERLAMLVDAAQQFVDTEVSTYRYAVTFARSVDMPLNFAIPEGVGDAAAPGKARSIPLDLPPDLDRNLASVRELLDEARR